MQYFAHPEWNFERRREEYPDGRYRSGSDIDPDEWRGDCFPDIRTKCAIQSGAGGSILLIPREGGHLFRMYVDLGEVDPNDKGAVRNTTIEKIIQKADDILHPYTLDVRNVAWHSVYEVGHRLTDRFDDVLPGDRGSRTPRVFITGDACHTHSAKAGQCMNVSMQAHALGDNVDLLQWAAGLRM